MGVSCAEKIIWQKKLTLKATQGISTLKITSVHSLKEKSVHHIAVILLSTFDSTALLFGL